MFNSGPYKYNKETQAIKPQTLIRAVFFWYISSGKGNKRENKQMGLYQTKKFCKEKENINEIKRQPTEWENIFTNDTCDKQLISKTYK